MLPSEGSGTRPIFPHHDILPMEKFTHERTLSLALSFTHKHTFPLLVRRPFFFLEMLATAKGKGKNGAAALPLAYFPCLS